MDLYVKDEKPIECVFLGSNKYKINKKNDFYFYLSYIFNLAANAYAYNSNAYDIVYTVIDFLCLLNNVSNDIAFFAKKDFVVFNEPGYVDSESGVLYLSTTVCNEMDMRNISLNISDVVYDSNISSTGNLPQQTILDPKISKVILNYIICADHIATHYIQSKIDKRPPDFSTHRDFHSSAKTLHNCFMILTEDVVATSNTNKDYSLLKLIANEADKPLQINFKNIV